MATTVSALLAWLPSAAWLALAALATAYFLLPRDKSLLDALIDLMPGRVSMMDYHLQLYKEYHGQKLALIMEGGTEYVFVRDVDLLKRVTITDFDHFTDLGFLPDALADVDGNDLGLGNTNGDHWRFVKAAVSPAFSIKNLKNICLQVNECALQLVSHLDTLHQSGDDVLVDDEVGCFAMAAIGRIVFSVDLRCIGSKDNAFVVAARDMAPRWRFVLAAMAPRLMAALSMPIFRPKSCRFFIEWAEQMIKQREGCLSTCPSDVLDVMMRASRQPQPDVTDATQKRADENKPPPERRLTSRMISRTLMQFFFDGFDTLASTVTMCLYLLAANPEEQARARAEVDAVASKMAAGSDVLDGDLVNELKYLDCCFKETARLAPFPVTFRRCTKEYCVPGYDLRLAVGTRVMLPIAGLQRDEAHFPDPEAFRPDRFLAGDDGDANGNSHAGTFLAWGIGPRKCLGMSISRLEAKVLLFHVLRNFSLSLSERMRPGPVVWDKAHFNKIEGGCWIKLGKRRR